MIFWLVSLSLHWYEAVMSLCDRTLQACHAFPAYLASGLLLLATAGCLSSSPEENEKLEHHVPAHKPLTFAAAVTELQTRCEEANAQELASTPEKFTELLDVIRWLPELAGDSDLGRADWETVQRLSQRLEDLLPPNRQADGQLTKGLAAAREIIEELKPFIPRANTRLSQ